jgi:hypothetical protein
VIPISTIFLVHDHICYNFGMGWIGGRLRSVLEMYLGVGLEISCTVLQTVVHSAGRIPFFFVDWPSV